MGTRTTQALRGDDPGPRRTSHRSGQRRTLAQTGTPQLSSPGLIYRRRAARQSEPVY
jgi:hypothetical protein